MENENIIIEIVEKFKKKFNREKWVKKIKWFEKKKIK
jgi:hypothetical protein